MTDQQVLEQIKKRRHLVSLLFPELPGSDLRQDIGPLLNSCPSCGYPTLDERCSWEICLICHWEDDGQDDADADQILGGPNKNYSLTRHRIETQKILNKAILSSDDLANALKHLDQLVTNYNPSMEPTLTEQLRIVGNMLDKKRRIGFGI